MLFNDTRFEIKNSFSTEKEEQLTNLKIQNLLVEKFLALISNAEERKAAYKNDPTVLTKGFWYSTTHYQAMIEMNAEISLLIQEGNFFHGLPPAGFKHDEDPLALLGKTFLSYTLNGEMQPSSAFQSVKENLCFIDCQEALEIAYYEVLLEILGQEFFDDYFRFDGANPLSLNPDITATPLFAFIDSLSESSEKMRVGDQRYFSNDPLYGFLHIYGEAQGYHVLCIQTEPEAKFAYFGGSAEGRTEKEMFELLHDDFNIKPLDPETLLTKELGEKLIAAISEENEEFHDLVCQGRMKVFDKDSQNPYLAPRIFRLNLASILALFP